MHESAQSRRSDAAGLCEQPAGPVRFRSRHQAGKPWREFTLLARIAVIVTSGCALCTHQIAFSETSRPLNMAALHTCTTDCAQHPGPVVSPLPGQSTRPASSLPGTVVWQGQRVALQSAQDRHHVQEQENSCVPAAVKNLIYALTGKDIPEGVIRKKLAEIANDGDYDFRQYGIDPVHALPVLEHFGVPSEAISDISVNELARLTDGGRPLLIGIRKPYLHWLMLDRVTIEAAGEMLFHVRNTKTPSGLPGVLTRQEFESAYNPSAIIIVPL